MAALSFDTIYKAFNENRTSTLLSLFVLAIIALFGLLYKGWLNEKKDLKASVVECKTENYTVKVEMSQLRDQFYKVSATLSRYEGRFEALEELKKQATQ